MRRSPGSSRPGAVGGRIAFGAPFHSSAGHACLRLQGGEFGAGFRNGKLHIDIRAHGCVNLARCHRRRHARAVDVRVQRHVGLRNHLDLRFKQLALRGAGFFGLRFEDGCSGRLLLRNDRAAHGFGPPIFRVGALQRGCGVLGVAINQDIKRSLELVNPNPARHVRLGERVNRRLPSRPGFRHAQHTIGKLVNRRARIHGHLTGALLHLPDAFQRAIHRQRFGVRIGGAGPGSFKALSVVILRFRKRLDDDIRAAQLLPAVKLLRHFIIGALDGGGVLGIAALRLLQHRGLLLQPAFFFRERHRNGVGGALQLHRKPFTELGLGVIYRRAEPREGRGGGIRPGGSTIERGAPLRYHGIDQRLLLFGFA